MKRSQGFVLFAMASAFAIPSCSSSGSGSDTIQDMAGLDMPGMDMPATDSMEEVAVPSCTEFCTQAQGVCSGANAQWATLAECEADCASWPVGVAGAMGGNTLACRVDHLAEIQDGSEDPEGHCPHVGPSGGGDCGTLCDEFCWLVQHYCTGGNVVFASDADCRTACAAFPDTGTQGDATGDTVQCRIYHATAARMDAVTHCPHTKVVSAVCM